MTLATMIAAVGIVTDSIILIIGAMVVGPEFGALAGLCVALVQRRPALARRSLTALLVGFPVAILATAAAVLALKGLGVLPESIGHHAETLFVSHPNRYSVIVAALAGVAGMISLMMVKAGVPGPSPGHQRIGRPPPASASCMRAGDDREHLVGVDGQRQAHAGEGARPAASRSAIALAWRALAEPQVVVEVREHLRAEIAALRHELAGALAAIQEVVGQGAVEEDHRLHAERAVLGGAEREHIHARLPGELGRRAAQAHQRVGETGAVHVHAQAPRARSSASAAPRPGVDRAEFGRLRERQHAGALFVFAAAHGGEHRGRPPAGVSLPAGAAHADQLGAAGEHLGRAALVDLDVRLVMADDRAVRRAARRQRQRIGGGAGDDQIGGQVALEDVAQPGSARADQSSWP